MFLLLLAIPLRIAEIEVRTPDVTEFKATVEVRTRVRNDRPMPAVATLQMTIRDASGQSIAMIESLRKIPAAGTAEFLQVKDGISHPHLWKADDPYVYRVELVLREGDRVLDTVSRELRFVIM